VGCKNMNEKQTLEDRITPQQIKTLEFLEQFNFKINSAAYFELDERWHCDGRFIEDSMFFVFFSGEAFVKIKDEEYLCHRSSISLMPENYIQKWWIKPSKQFEVIRMAVIHLDPFNAWNLNLFKLFKSCFIDCKNIQYWQRRFLQFVSLYNSNKVVGGESGKSLLKEFFTALVYDGLQLNEPEKQIDNRLFKVLTYIHENYASDIDVEELAEIARLSSTQLRKIFFNEMHINPKEYIYHFRLKQAVEMLRHTNLTIKEITFKVGFKNDHYFHNSFKKKFKLTPSDFRKRGLQEFV